MKYTYTNLNVTGHPIYLFVKFGTLVRRLLLDQLAQSQGIGALSTLTSVSGGQRARSCPHCCSLAHGWGWGAVTRLSRQLQGRPPYLPIWTNCSSARNGLSAGSLPWRWAPDHIPYSPAQCSVIHSLCSFVLWSKLHEEQDLVRGFSNAFWHFIKGLACVRFQYVPGWNEYSPKSPSLLHGFPFTPVPQAPIFQEIQHYVWTLPLSTKTCWGQCACLPSFTASACASARFPLCLPSQPAWLPPSLACVQGLSSGCG